jgi:DNA-binding GntR family transcriptional regulator
MEYTSSAGRAQLSAALGYRSLAETVTDEIRSRIREGVLKPKERLTESALAAQLGISRAPVREALRSLAEQGFVVHVPRRGYRVGWLTPKALQETYLTRQVMECLAVRQIVESPGSGLERAANAIKEMELAIKRNDIQAVVRTDLGFHHELVVASGNEVLLAAHKLITGPLVPALNLLVPYELAQLRGRVNHYANEHRAILQTIQAGKIDEACRLLTKHLHDAMTNVLTLMSRNPMVTRRETT